MIWYQKTKWRTKRVRDDRETHQQQQQKKSPLWNALKSNTAVCHVYTDAFFYSITHHPVHWHFLDV